MHRQLSRHEGALPVRSPSARVLLLALDPTPTSSRGQSRHGPYNAGLLPGLRMLATVKGDAADDEVQDGTTSIPDVAHAPRRRLPTTTSTFHTEAKSTLCCTLPISDNP